MAAERHDWHRTRIEAAARVLAEAASGESDLRRAELAVRAADQAVGGVVPREEYEQLALDYSAMRVRALQDEDLLDRALQALDRIATESATAMEVRAMLDARREHQDGERNDF